MGPRIGLFLVGWIVASSSGLLRAAPIRPSAGPPVRARERVISARALTLARVALGIAPLWAPRAPRSDEAVDKPRLRHGDRLAIAGDSITEQKLYSRDIELYLDLCAPDLRVRVMTFGWSGERIGGLAARLQDDILPFRPDVVTLGYGMNDGLYKPYAEATGQAFRQGLEAVVARFEQAGCRVVLGSPGMVDPDTFDRNGLDPAVYNDCLERLGEIARSVASASHAVFADNHAALAAVMPRAKERFGLSYHLCGADGIHPAPNGHLVMAQVFLEALGLEGEIGVVTVRFRGSEVERAEATAGHTVIEARGRRVTLESRRWPFCFTGDGTSPLATRSIAPLLSFNERLNRFILRVVGLTTSRAVVTWGARSRPFSRRDLERGVNLAAHFDDSPFVEPFQAVDRLVLDKQRFETDMIKRGVAASRGPRTPSIDDPEAEKARRLLYQRLLAKADRLDDRVRAAIVPVRHTIEILPDPGEPGGKHR